MVLLDAAVGGTRERPPNSSRLLAFLAIALGSASEVRYLVGLAQRLELLDDATATTLTASYTDFIRGLQTLITSLQSRT